MFKTGKLNVVQLRGTFHQMGRQFGRLLSSEFKELYDIAVDRYLLKQRGKSFDALRTEARALFDPYPERFKQVIYGMAETSGLDLDRHIVLNAVELLTISAFAESLPGAGRCSGIAAWGPYTGGGPLLYGRNYDLCGVKQLFRDMAKFWTVAVFNPTGSCVPVASLNYPGVLYLQTGMNRRGLFLALNNGELSGGSVGFASRIPTLIQTFTFLLDSASMEELDAHFNTTRSSASYIINVADRQAAFSYEWPTFDLRRRGGAGLMVATNDFADPTWGLPQPPASAASDSRTRRDNLTSLAAIHRGKIDPRRMMEILDLPLDKGGATFPAGTIYQVVGVPEQLKLWIKVPDFQDWTEIDLGPLFD
ncbi:MAG: hypothetical protein HY815_33055 [Candidatus Riflebacteria bacterium]|nr:hypothetical protein [Candidatus Riflebacteria bacterium]